MDVTSKEPVLSALSKVFVGVLIVLSLLLSSAVIVWVNKTEEFKNIAAKADAARIRAEKIGDDAKADAAAAKLSLQDAIKSYGAQVDALQNDMKAKEQKISEREVEVAKLNGQVSAQLTAIASANEALKASESQKKIQADQITELRNSTDKLLKDKTDVELALSDATNQLALLKSEWKNFKEERDIASAQVDKLTRQLKDMGVNPSAAPTGLKLGAPSINGVIREVRTMEDNHQWATISVGSADQVVKGMEFKVIDRSSGTFLGILTVQNVQPKEAVGILTGPKANEVKVGQEVRTQL